MPGSTTTPSQERTRNIARPHVAFRLNHGVGTRELKTFAAQWPACALLCRRFADALTGATARLEVDMIRYIFIVEDFHFVFLAGLPAHGSNLRRRFQRYRSGRSPFWRLLLMPIYQNRHGYLIMPI